MAVTLGANETLTRPGIPVLGGTYYTSGSEPTFFTIGNQVGSPFVSSFYDGSGDFAGSLTTTVYKDPNNNNCLGFEYVWRTTALSTADLVTCTIGGTKHPWLGWTILDTGTGTLGSSTDRNGGSGWADETPNTIFRDAVSAGEGVGVQWEAASIGTVLRGTNSDQSSTIWFVTDAPAYQTVRAALIDSGANGSADAYAPADHANFVQEPATASLLGVGLAVLAWRRRRRNR